MNNTNYTPDLKSALRAHVDRGEVAGVVSLIARGDDVQVEALGVQDLAMCAPMQRDTIFRIASMTKPIVAAAAMLLVEEEKIGLDDPVDRWLPELANRRVLRTLASPLDETVPAKRAITIRDLMTLRLGIGAIMEELDDYPIQAAMDELEITPSADVFAHSPDEFMKRLGSLPLLHQPGEQWMYQTGLDVLSVLIARASGMSLGAFMTQRIFEPLAMRDTGFSVGHDNISRLATCYERDASGKLVVWDEGRGGIWSRPPTFEADGGGGLVSTVDDYLAFARMMLDGGTRGQQRILSPQSIAAMTTDQITPEQKAVSAFFPGFWDSNGWGFGLSMTTGPDDISTVPGRHGWAGGFGTTYSADPHEDMIAILMTQRLVNGPDDFAINTEFLKLAYGRADSNNASHQGDKR